MEILNEHIAYLESLVYDLSDNLARNGKNKAIRDKESNKISSAVLRLENYLENNRDLSLLLLQYHNGNQYGYNETLSFMYLVRDTPRFIEFLKAKLIGED